MELLFNCVIKQQILFIIIANCCLVSSTEGLSSARRRLENLEHFPLARSSIGKFNTISGSNLACDCKLSNILVCENTILNQVIIVRLLFSVCCFV